MTDTNRGLGGVVGPPWSVEVLADLHAGALAPEVEAELWPKVRADPEARAILDALDATRSDLSEFGAEPASMPADVAARIDAAIENESAQRVGQAPENAEVSSLSAARGRKQRKVAGWTAGVLTTAAAAAAVAIGLTGLGGTNELGGVAAPEQSQGNSQPDREPLALGNAEQLGNRYPAAMGVHEYGPLDNPERLSKCLAANDIQPDIDVVGVRPATLDGKDGVLVIVPTQQEAGQLRALVVGPDCGPGNPATIADQVIGSR